MESLRVVTLNVNGLNDPAKRRIIFDHLRNAKADVYLLQETHATTDSVRLWTTEWGGPILASNGTQSSRGVMIMCARNLSFSTMKRLQDDNGRLIAVDLVIAGITYTIISIYAPTQDKPREQLDTLEKMEQLLEELESTNVIIGGDFNCVMDPVLDKNTPNPCHPASAATRSKIQAFKEEWTLTDIWRARNQGKRGFTFRRGNYSSRLDMLLISAHLSNVASNIKVKNIAHSDHAMILCSLRRLQDRKGPGLWKFDSSLLDNKIFVSDMQQFLSGWSAPEELLNPNSIWEWMKHEIQRKIRDFIRDLHSTEKQHLHSMTDQ